MRVAALRKHFISDRSAGRVKGFMQDNRWSNLEARQSAFDVAETEAEDVLKARLFGDARERTRFIKKLYYRLPIGIRALLYSDGVPGLYFAFFQAFWFRMLVDAKVYEHRAATGASTGKSTSRVS